ncbi:MAG: hypothetical protein AAF658_04985, partial [Myxococcota bacterium]
MSDDSSRGLPAPTPGLPPSPVQEGAEAAMPSSRRFPQEPIDRFLAGEISFDSLQGMSVYDAYAVAEAGHALYERGRFRDAQSLFEGLAMANPYDAYFQGVLGAVFQALGEDESAMGHYDRCLNLNPD